ncbi:MAG TPA: hypothetical protein VFG21_11240 [Xanthomonadaceae bacterium]|nr:hypothetical protein [Xanthomonadaceae bacterium]
MLSLALAATAVGGETLSSKDAFTERQAKLAAIEPKSTTSADRIFADPFEPLLTQADCDSDRDGDGIPDCAETHTGRYVDITDTGTDPDNPDTDGDGLSDGDEVFGTVDGLDLPALGVNPLRRDVLVEYDWFESDYECGTHSQRPTDAMLQDVARMFADAPVANPDGSTGIHLIQDAGQGGALTGGNRVTGFDAILPGRFDATWREIKDANFAPNRLGYFHYVLLPHRYDGGSNSSGYAEVVGDDAIVSMACHTSQLFWVNTIAHELGHNLGLLHGGFEHCNYKPNYSSVMNYRFQFAGMDTGCEATGDRQSSDFSRGDRLVLDESALDEPLGVCGAPAIDWNKDGQLQSALIADLNAGYEATCGGQQYSVLEDFDDWNNITLLGIRDSTGKLKSVQTEIACAGAPVDAP